MFKRRGTKANPYIYSLPMPLGAGGGKLRVLYAIRQSLVQLKRLRESKVDRPISILIDKNTSCGWNKT